MNEHPPEVTSRIRNDMVSARPRAMRGRVGVGMLSAIDWALTLNEKRRPQTVAQWREAIERGTLPPVAAPASGPTHAPTVKLAPQPSAQIHPIRPAAAAAAPATPGTPKARGTPPPNAMAYPQTPPAAARAATAQPRASSGTALRTNAGGIVNRPRASLHWGWAVLLAAAVGSAVWIGRSRSQAAIDSTPQKLTFEKATGPVTIHGRVVSIGKPALDSGATAAAATPVTPDLPLAQPQGLTIEAHAGKVSTALSSPRDGVGEHPPAPAVSTGARTDIPDTIEASGLIQQA
jgi:hypothetical protein